MPCVEALAVGFKRVKLKRVMDAQAVRFIGFALARIAILYIRFRRRVSNWARGLAWWGARRRAVAAALAAGA